MSYTKGKFKDGSNGWKVCNNGPHYNNKSVTNYEIHYNDDGECVVDHVYEEDDAHIIAAAPCMYEALKELVVQFEDILNKTNDSCDWHHEALEFAKDMIKKAEGK